MSKWRPSKDCIYVIPDIHGNVQLLDLILDRILPPRKNDKIVFLGDYIDRHIDSHEVIERLINIKTDYPNNIVCLMGNHEHMALRAMNESGENLQLYHMTHNHKMWMNNGGLETIAGYIKQYSKEDGLNVLDVPRFRLSSIIPKSHIKFMQDLHTFYKYDKYIFVHGGMNPLEPVEKHDKEVLLWDRQLKDIVLSAIDKDLDLPWENTIVTGHNVRSGHKPIIHDKFMMLDCGSPSKLLVVELNSKQGFMAFPGFERLVKYEIKNTVKENNKTLIRRIT